MIASITFKTIYKQFIPTKDLHSAPKKNFENSFGNRTVILAKMKENAELVDVLGTMEHDAGTRSSQNMPSANIENAQFFNHQANRFIVYKMLF